MGEEKRGREMKGKERKGNEEKGKGKEPQTKSLAMALVFPVSSTEFDVSTRRKHDERHHWV